jgi:polyisoprenyl-teichoic acid--peptidoglycan teichoic acid transferase
MKKSLDRQNRSTIKDSLRSAALVLLIIVLTAGSGGAAFAAARELGYTWQPAQGWSSPQLITSTLPADTPQETQSSPEPGDSPTPTLFPTNPNTLPSLPSYLPWDRAGRVTILLMGLDARDGGVDTAAEARKPARSDTMILLTLDPQTMEAGILSIPRDLWVAIPGYYNAKINTAHYLGQAHKLPGGGPGLAIKTVETFLGVDINYYAVIDFYAFERFIDEIGGVEVTVDERLRIDMLGSGPDTQRQLEPGQHTLNGPEALAYARARNTQGGDFDRAARQQQVIMGIFHRILNLQMLPTLIGKAPTLYNELANGIDTNLPLHDAIRLSMLAAELEPEDIDQGVIGPSYVLAYNAVDISGNHLAVLVPIPDKINLLRDEIFNESGALAPAAQGTLEEKVAAEGARLRITNLTSLQDLDETVAEYLRSHGVVVAEVGGGSGSYAATSIVDHTGNPYLVQYLTELYGLQPGRIRLEFNPDSPVDVEIFLAGNAANIKLP